MYDFGKSYEGRPLYLLRVRMLSQCYILPFYENFEKFDLKERKTLIPVFATTLDIASLYVFLFILPDNRKRKNITNSRVQANHLDRWWNSCKGVDLYCRCNEVY